MKGWYRVVLGFLFTSMPRVAAAQNADSAALQIVISIEARRLWVIGSSADTLLSAPAAVGSDRTLNLEGTSWTFRTPRGAMVITAKDSNPIWVPPTWHYVELARSRRLKLDSVSWSRPVSLSSGRTLVVRGTSVGVLEADSLFTPLLAGEEIVFDGTLFIPPFGTEQRRLPGVMGAYRLRLASGVGIHGTPDSSSIGKAVTHGCIRLYDADIAWLYENVPVGTRVVIF